MQRDQMLARIEEKKEFWDFIIIGGGATGVGAAIEAASRGYKTVLLEQHDFGKGTSSRSTKLIHGGVRYLAQGNITLVLEALKERGILRRNAPHLVHNLPFIVPNYDWWEGPFYGIGLKLYDMLAGKEGFGSSRILSKKKTMQHLPTIESEGLNGGVRYYDGQFDDARLVINLAQTAVEQGATILNYIKVVELTKYHNMIDGVIAHELEHGKEYQLKSKAVINATGVFSDAIRQMDDPNAVNMIIPSQGVHIVLDKSFLPGDSAIMVPHTDDGRVLFAIPWHSRVIVGTTDTPVDTATLEPVPYPDELEFLLTHTARYLTKDPAPSDVLSAFAGLRPLVGKIEESNTAAISRDHTIHISRCGLISIAGGKWTTYRKMAQDTVDQAVEIAGVDPKPSVTEHLNIHGHHNHPKKYASLALYGSDARLIKQLAAKNSELAKPLHPDFPYIAAEVIWAVRHEMARTVEDFLTRRRRAVLLDARASIEMAARVAALMADELHKDKSWQTQQVDAYTNLARAYIL